MGDLFSFETFYGAFDGRLIRAPWETVDSTSTACAVFFFVSNFSGSETNVSTSDSLVDLSDDKTSARHLRVNLG